MLIKNLENSQTILFFDGKCNLCNQLVDFLVRRNDRLNYHFSSLQGESSKKLLSAQDRSLDTVVLLKGERVYKRSQAAFCVFNDLGGAWKLLSYLKVLPTNITDFFYKIIARYRYAIWGKRETCRLPSPREKDFFLP